MTLTLHYHPLSSYCWKVLIPLYEKALEFERVVIDFGSPDSVEAFRTVWPMSKMPVLVEDGLAIPESSIIAEYLDLKPGEGPKLIPEDPVAALKVRLRDRFYDLFVHQPMQKIVGDRLRPEGSKDPHGVEEARQTLRKSYKLLEGCFAPSPWAAGESFTLADCSASPALFYADKVEPLGEDRPSLVAFLDRLKARPAFERVLEEAEPFFRYFPA
jgi:glutathione S-transferase